MFWLLYFWIFLVFLGHLPTFFLSLFEISKAWLTVQFVVYCFFNYLVIINIFLHAFLGMDRFLAVFFPHTFKRYKTRTRILKIFTVFILTSTMFSNLFCERYFGLKSIISVTFRSVVWSICTLLNVITFVNYIAIALRLKMRNTRIAVQSSR